MAIILKPQRGQRSQVNANRIASQDSYIFPFEGNPDWSKFYVDQKEIHAYIKNTAKKYDLCKYVQLNTTIKETIWDEESAKWKIKIEQGGETKEDEADFLINSSGFLK